MFNKHCTMCSVHCTMYNVQCAVYSVRTPSYMLSSDNNYNSLYVHNYSYYNNSYIIFA